MSKTQALILIALIILTALFGGIPQAQHPVVMKRESQPIHYLVALDLSYQAGVEAVDWSLVEWPRI